MNGECIEERLSRHYLQYYTNYLVLIIICCVHSASYKNSFYYTSFNRRPQLEFTKLSEVRHSTFYPVHFFNTQKMWLLTSISISLPEGLLKPGALVDVNADGIQRVTNGSYAFIKVISQFFSFFDLLGNN